MVYPPTMTDFPAYWAAALRAGYTSRYFTRFLPLYVKVHLALHRFLRQLLVRPAAPGPRKTPDDVPGVGRSRLPAPPPPSAGKSNNNGPKQKKSVLAVVLTDISRQKWGKNSLADQWKLRGVRVFYRSGLEKARAFSSDGGRKTGLGSRPRRKAGRKEGRGAGVCGKGAREKDDGRFRREAAVPSKKIPIVRSLLSLFFQLSRLRKSFPGEGKRRYLTCICGGGV